MGLLFFFIAVTAVSAQFVPITENGPARITTDPDARPASRQFASLWCDSNDQYLFGGAETRDFWKLEGETRRWIWMPDGPGPVGRYDALKWSLYGQMWLYGGKTTNNGILDDLWSFTVPDRMWHAKTISSPPGKRHGSITWVSPLTNRLFLYGGGGENTTIPWSYDVVTEEWVEHTDFLGPDIGNGAQFAQIEDQLYVLTADNRFYKLATEALVWMMITVGEHWPMPRASGLFFPSAQKDALYLFGGYQGAQMYQDLWKFDPALSDWTEILDGTFPSPRYGAASCIDDQHRALFMFGGAFNDRQITNDAWRYGKKENLQDFVSSIQFHLDSATVTSFWAAIMSSLSLVILVTLSIVICAQKLKQCKKHKYQATSVIDNETL